MVFRGYAILFCGDGFLGKHFADAADLGADSLQFFFNVFVTTIDVVDAVDDGLAVGDQRGQHERSRGAQIGRASCRERV